MPKQSQKLKPTKKTKSSIGFKFVKYTPHILMMVSIIMVFSLHLRLWLLEFVASYIPQILILLSPILLLYIAISTYLIFNHGSDKFQKYVGRVSFIHLAVAATSLIYVLVFSLNIIEPAEIVTKGDAADTMKIATFNRLYKNKNFHEDAQVIAGEQVDIVSFEETTSEDLEYFKSISDLEYSFITDCNCSAYTTEVGLISRYPIVNAITIYENENAVILRSLIDSDDFGQFAVYSVHIHVPYVHNSYDLRDDMYRVLSTAVNAEDLSTFVVGDFNTSIFSPDMQRFMSETASINNTLSRQWPKCSWFGYSSLLCSRIDYIFVPDDSSVVDIKILDNQYSDHRAVLVELDF